jgi:hypothetical protein
VLQTSLLSTLRPSEQSLCLLLAPCWFLLGSLFDPTDAVVRSSETSVDLYRIMAIHYTLHNDRCENLNPNLFELIFNFSFQFFTEVVFSDWDTTGRRNPTFRSSTLPLSSQFKCVGSGTGSVIQASKIAQHCGSQLLTPPSVSKGCKESASDTKGKGVRKWNHVWPNKQNRYKNSSSTGHAQFFVKGGKWDSEKEYPFSGAHDYFLEGKRNCGKIRPF